MMSNFELETLAKLIHEDTIAKAQQRRLTRNMRIARHKLGDEYPRFVIREGKPCQC